ncbi:MAG: hypothetical protein ABSH51_26085 [Solirubrobacteraceae bacterium]|jgi:hypothetical protein
MKITTLAVRRSAGLGCGIVAILLSSATAALAAPGPVSLPAATAQSSPAVSPTVAQIVAEAKVTGLDGTLFQYHPATGSWTQIAVIGQPETASVDADAASGWTSNLACILVSLTIGACDNVAITFKEVVPNTDAQIIGTLESMATDDAEKIRIGTVLDNKEQDIIRGASADRGSEVEGAMSDAFQGVEDGALDFGSGVVEALPDIAFFVIF